MGWQRRQQVTEYEPNIRNRPNKSHEWAHHLALEYPNDLAGAKPNIRQIPNKYRMQYEYIVVQTQSNGPVKSSCNSFRKYTTIFMPYEKLKNVLEASRQLPFVLLRSTPLSCSCGLPFASLRSSPLHSATPPPLRTTPFGRLHNPPLSRSHFHLSTFQLRRLVPIH